MENIAPWSTLELGIFRNLGILDHIRALGSDKVAKVDWSSTWEIKDPSERQNFKEFYPLIQKN